MNIVICDDDLLYRDAIADPINQWIRNHDLENQSIVRCFSSTEDLLEAWQSKMQIDLLFLDIEIPGEMSGLDLARTIRQEDHQLNIVFVTNYAEYACDGYSVNALRYLKKPIPDHKLFECLDIVFHQCEFLQETSILVESQRHSIVLPLKQIIYLQSSAHYVAIYCVYGKTLQIRRNISQLLTELPTELFIQCHRGYIVNLLYVRSITKADIAMAGGFRVPIGAKFVNIVLKRVNQYYQGIEL
ncbi:MAG: LytTR family DNA-binding domain-containing protein [Clostridia bacterium]